MMKTAGPITVHPSTLFRLPMLRVPKCNLELPINLSPLTACLWILIIIYTKNNNWRSQMRKKLPVDESLCHHFPPYVWVISHCVWLPNKRWRSLIYVWHIRWPLYSSCVCFELALTLNHFFLTWATVCVSEDTMVTVSVIVAQASFFFTIVTPAETLLKSMENFFLLPPQRRLFRFLQ